ncbi:MAG: ATP synthase subunit I [Acidobacteria bacterium]|nr:ATP synthase subunit I [Acidobacteriota bacterium]
MTTESELRRTNRGILAVMFVVVAVMAVAGAAAYGLRASIGVLVGGLLAWLNYRWLDQSTRAILVDPTAATTPILAIRYVLRYVLIAAVLLGIWFYDLLPVTAVIAGLASFALAVVLRGLKSIFTSSL